MALDIQRRNGRFLRVGMTLDEYHYMNENGEGLCVACGEVACGVEPDAERYECESCGDPYVWGIEQLLIMGRVEITGGIDE
jgi:hypothetical protein